VQTVNLSDLPDGTREWLLDSVPALYDGSARAI